MAYRGRPLNKANSIKQPLRVGLISLGCAKNLVDAEIMLGRLLEDGLVITNDPEQAEVLIVNTCSFIDSAQQESIDAILGSAELRTRKNEKQALIVSGCLPQRFREDLPGLLPEVDAFMGIDQVSGVSEIVRQAVKRRATKLTWGQAPKPGGAKKSARQGLAALEKSGGNALKMRSLTPPALPVPEPALLQVHSRPTYIPDFATPRFRLTPPHSAYVKIAEGCNHPCSFCIIPRMRGSHRSRPQPDVVAEARGLIAAGVRELNLISQDSTYYGLDLRPHSTPAIASPERFGAALKSMPASSATICTLLRELNGLPGDFWIRLLYTHPAHWTQELIQTIAECPKVARYVDIPLQHIHQNMLERMRRETSREYIEDLLRRIRAGVPGIALRTTFIVGFPGETEESFQSLLDFIREARFERLGVFSYSREEGTRAGDMAGQIPEKTRRRRRDLAMSAQRRIAREVSESWVGRTIKVLVEGRASARQAQAATVSSWEHGLVRAKGSAVRNAKSHVQWIARGEADAPDIDGRVYVRGTLPIGEFAWVRIVGHSDYDLMGVPA
jgi:ribosomal protein S12 methylthiotransferase